MLLNPAFLKLYRFPLLMALSSGLFYWAFAYDLTRTDYVKLLMLYAALFFMFYKLVQIFENNLKLLTYLAFSFRAIFILAIPNLSQDFYRFIWDGRMIMAGINPYLYTPEYLIGQGNFPIAQAKELYEGMGVLSAGHFTNYPPINQLCFTIAALFAGKSILGSVIMMRLIIIAADFGTLHFGKKLLEKLKIPEHNIFLYILNPFIIIELTGNLHFEGIMIFFLMLSLYLLHVGKWQWAAVVLALSISVKLVPLIFLPLLFQWFTKSKRIAHKKKQSFVNDEILKQVQHNGSQNPVPSLTGIKRLLTFYSIVLGGTLLLFAPFYSSAFVTNYAETVALWFQEFEFNASLYYLAREIGYAFRGYNEIAIIGKIIPVIVASFVILIAFFRRNKTTVQLITGMLFVLSFYYFTATTVHPWYVATILILSVFTKYKFPMVWSFAVILSYLAYLGINSMDKSENLLVIALEYVTVYSFFIWEVFIKKASEKEA